MLEDILRRLADQRWRELRRAHNNRFMSEGPGERWNAFKSARSAEFEEIKVLRAYLGLKPE